MAATFYPQSPPAEEHGRSLCLGEDRRPAMPSPAARKVDFMQGRLPPTLMPVMRSCGPENRQLQLLLVMGVDDFSGRCYPA